MFSTKKAALMSKHKVTLHHIQIRQAHHLMSYDYVQEISRKNVLHTMSVFTSNNDSLKTTKAGRRSSYLEAAQSSMALLSVNLALKT